MTANPTLTAGSLASSDPWPRALPEPVITLALALLIALGSMAGAALVDELKERRKR